MRDSKLARDVCTSELKSEGKDLRRRIAMKGLEIQRSGVLCRFPLISVWVFMNLSR